ncbi:prepilin peptidase [Litorivicinus sp.]|nr:prepilin peptidase [Litorivicinus sp.]
MATIALSVEQHPLWAAFTLVLTASLLVGALIDHTTGLLPFRVALIIAIGALLYTSSVSPEDTVIAVLTAVIGSSTLMLMNWISWRWRRLTLLGGGDIALLAALSLCLSGTDIALIIWAASLTGPIESRWRRRSMIHFGPHLAIAALCCWYLKVIL